MIAALIELITGSLGPYLLGLVGVIGGAAVAYFKGRSDAKAKSDNAVLRSSVAAKDEQLEMHREASQEEIRVAAMTAAAKKKEARTWSDR